MNGIDQTLFGEVSEGMLRFLGIWYNEWGAFLAFLLALVAAFVIFLDAFRNQLGAMWYKVAAVVGAILVIPSVVLRISPDLGANIGPALVPLAFVGLIGFLIAFVALITYLAWGRGAEQRALATGGYVQTEQMQSEVWMESTAATGPMTPSSVPMYTPPGGTQTPGPVAPATQPVMDVRETAAVVAPPAATQILRRAPKEMGMLIARSGPRAGQTFNLLEVTNIGRDPQRNEISLDDAAMSRENSRIKLENGQFVAYDLASTNGTFVNGEKILKQVLANGDEIQIGDTSFAFVEVKTKGN